MRTFNFRFENIYFSFTRTFEFPFNFHRALPPTWTSLLLSWKRIAWRDRIHFFTYNCVAPGSVVPFACTVAVQRRCGGFRVASVSTTRELLWSRIGIDQLYATITASDLHAGSTRRHPLLLFVLVHVVVEVLQQCRLCRIWLKMS